MVSGFNSAVSTISLISTTTRKRAKQMMANVDKFKEKLQNYDPISMSEEVSGKVAAFCADEAFAVEVLAIKSAAAAMVSSTTALASALVPCLR